MSCEVAMLPFKANANYSRLLSNEGDRMYLIIFIVIGFKGNKENCKCNIVI